MALQRHFSLIGKTAFFSTKLMKKKCAANRTGSKLSQCSAIIFLKCNLLKKGSPTKIAISQVLESSIKAQIQGFDVRCPFMIIGDLYFTLSL